MTKKIFTLLICCMMSAILMAQAYNPDYKDYVGTTTMRLPNGWYYGQVRNGYPEGNGYAYYKDSKLGWVIYKGQFAGGYFSGTGDVLCEAGFIGGNWEKSKLKKRSFADKNHIVYTCDDMKQTFHQKIQSKSLDLAEIVLPGGNTALVEQISDDTMLGRKALKRFWK